MKKKELKFYESRTTLEKHYSKVSWLCVLYQLQFHCILTLIGNYKSTISNKHAFTFSVIKKALIIYCYCVIIPEHFCKSMLIHYNTFVHKRECRMMKAFVKILSAKVYIKWNLPKFYLLKFCNVWCTYNKIGRMIQKRFWNKLE